MAKWRHLAVKEFEELKTDLNSREYSLYQLFFDLLPMVQEAVKNNDLSTRKKVYGFAQWCLRQKTGDTANAAGVAFYEHVFDRNEGVNDVFPFMDRESIDCVMGLWKARLSALKILEIEMGYKKLYG